MATNYRRLDGAPWTGRIVRQVFVDESVRRDGFYRLTAVAVPAAEMAVVARSLRERAQAGSSRVHFSSEGDRRRRAILRSLAELPIEAVTVVAPFPVRSDEAAARASCVRELVRLSAGKVATLTFDTRGPDRDKADRQVIRRALTELGGAQVVYGHRGSRDEILLSLPDAIGWAVGARGRWWPLVAGFTSVVEVSG